MFARGSDCHKLKGGHLTLNEIAELQSIYSQLYLSGHIPDATYRAVVNATMLSMNGINDIGLGIIAEDMRCLDKLKDLIPKLQAKCAS